MQLLATCAEHMERRVAIIGAGISGLLACKYILEKGFHPIVFEAENDIGGLWRHTMASTKLQNDKGSFQFSDFPWHSSVKEVYPNNQQVIDYLDSYAQHFDIIPYIRFNTKVIHIDYMGESSEEMKSWELWGGNGSPFPSNRTWHIEVQDTNTLCTEVYEVEFVILCLGLFSGVPYIPEFPPGQGPEIFKGKVMHSMDYSAMDNAAASELIKRKRVTIVGSQKSAIDLAAECANANVKHPCTMIQRTMHWQLPDDTAWGINLGFLYLSRFGEFLVHKPGETFLLSLVATLLSPLRWGISKLVESSIRWKLPMKKYGLLPSQSFLQDLSSCQISMLPENFYDKIKEGSIVIKKSQSFSFSKEGLIIEGEAKPLETDIVILATGYKGGQKFKSIFKSPIFQEYINGSPTSNIPLYRQIIHPRIPQLAVIGYAEAHSNVFASEMRCQWLAHLLDGEIELPNIRDMEKDIKLWEDNMKQYPGKCIRRWNIWYNDQLCKDMGCNPRRKKGLFEDLFEPYGPTDYVGLTRK